MSYQITKFHHLSNHELTNLVSLSECSQLEIELAQRLEESERENAELAESKASDEEGDDEPEPLSLANMPQIFEDTK